MSYIAIKNFKDGEKHKWNHYKIGDVYSGANADHFLKNGFIKDSDSVAEESNKSIEQQMAECKAKYDSLKAKLIATKKQKPVVKDEEPEKSEDQSKGE